MKIHSEKLDELGSRNRCVNLYDETVIPFSMVSKLLHEYDKRIWDYQKSGG